MIKALLIIFLVAGYMASQAQVNDSSLVKIGATLKKTASEMIKFDKQMKAGLFMQIAGGMVIVAGTRTTGPGVMIAGGLLSFAGFIISNTSSIHIRNAAIILRGNGIEIPFGDKKR